MKQADMSHKRHRIAFFDSLRGFTIVSMVAFHAAYDATYLFGLTDLAWFNNPIIQNVWRSSISWVFLLLAGWMTSLSRNNIKRGALYAAAACAVYIATTFVAVDTPINFGILFCMAASTLIAAALMPLLRKVPACPALIISLVLFALTYAIPHVRYPCNGLAWLGFPSYAFSSGDYYPLIPYSFMYAAGIFAALLFEKRFHGTYPKWMERAHVPVLEQVGKYSLPIYLVHQPLLLAIFALITVSF